MDKKSMQTLEFDKIIEQLRQYVTCGLGADLVQNLTVYTEIEKIRYHLAITSEARALYAVDKFTLRGLKDIRAMLARAKIGAILSLEDLLATAETLNCVRRTRSFVLKRQKRYPLIAELCLSLIDLPHIVDAINACINPEGFVKDRASAKLQQLRRQIRQVEGQIKAKVEGMVRSPQIQKYLQENLVTVRNDRYVIPVKIEYKNQVPGIIHDQSASGSTLFIEPAAVVELSNKQKQLLLAEGKEIERIIYELSQQVAEHAEDIAVNVNIMSVMDFVMAKGILSLEMSAIEPTVNAAGIIKLDKARHPLINPAEVVPINVSLGKDFSILVITGPNTGGKTVTLKTIGLLQIMAQAGLHIPAGIHSEVGVFDNVFADIGDEQSIEQNLSTFSSHMTNIIHILELATCQSLVLFDELGAGTDPTEGAALAMSILDEMQLRGVKVAATTHYSELKAYAYNKAAVMNGSMEFDIDTLRPTYRLTIGLPGRSNAFLISQRLGLASNIIEHARYYISQEAQQVEDMIQELENNRLQAENDRIEMERLKIEASRMKQESEQKLRELEEFEASVKQDALREARQYVTRIKKTMDIVLQDFKKQLKDISSVSDSDRAATKAQESINTVVSELKEAEKTVSSVQVEKTPTYVVDKGAIVKGDPIRHLKYNKEGVALTDCNEKGEIQVQLGAMRVWVPLKDLQKIKVTPPKQKAVGTRVVRAKQQTHVPLELDIRGKTVLEAQDLIDKYLDNAVLSSRSEVTIIHGKGTGALRQGVQEYLATHSLVEAQRLGHAAEGGSGVTVVTIKK